MAKPPSDDETLFSGVSRRAFLKTAGVGPADNMRPVQAAFVEADALQCGFCTPGFVVASTALLAHNPSPSLEEVKDGLAGNVCRCGTYSRVFEAVLKAAKATSSRPGRKA